MSNVPQVFIFESNEVRTVEKDGDIWFVANDVAKVLGYIDCKQAISDHCKSSILLKGVESIPFTSSPRGINIIPERDLYRLIMRSKLPSAEKFENWVVSEVLPTIRKTGQYVAPQTPELQIANALILASKMIEDQKLLIANMTPKAEFYDTVMTSNDTIDMASVAKVLNMGIGRNRLFALLREKDILQANNHPYQRYVDSGYFKVTESKYTKSNGDICISLKTVVYQKGLDYIRKIVSES